MQRVPRTAGAVAPASNADSDAVEALQLATALSEKWRLEGEARRRMADLEKTIDDQQHNRALAEAQFSAVLAERNRP